MGLRHPSVLIGCIVLAIALAASAQQPAQPQTSQTPPGPPVIKSQARVVLLDSVVTDKKGNYIRDLTAKDFKVWEDNKEQQITSFSRADDPTAPDYSEKKYMVLFFDTSVRDFLRKPKSLSMQTSPPTAKSPSSISAARSASRKTSPPMRHASRRQSKISAAHLRYQCRG